MTTNTARGPVIAGLGITETGKVYGRSAADFEADAVRRTADDAGLALSDWTACSPAAASCREWG
ncbi:hypothetical protein ACWD4G_07690 [Streptomyces sp. NPDC002643]